MEQPPSPPDHDGKVVTLCGSTRFGADFAGLERRLTLEGCLVLAPVLSARPDGPAARTRLAQLHRQRIRMADEVYVVDPGGYVGESTRGEIAYAEALGKPVRYLSRDGGR